MNGDASSNEKSSLAILLVTSQTFSVEQKEQVLNKINSSLRQIDESQLAVNLEDELNFVTRSNPFDSYFDKEHRVQSRNANFNFELLINSTLNSFKRAVRSLLQSECKIKSLICAGIDHNLQLVLQDSLLSCDEFSGLLTEPETLQFLNTQQSNIQFNFNSKSISENSSWKHLEKLPHLYNKNTVKLIGSAVEQSGDERKSYTGFTHYLANYLNERSIVDLMEETKITGTLNIDRPSLYIFPAREGDCSFFALNGYSMLIDGGYDRTKPCFWQFASMLKQLDSILLTHADADALGGLSSFFAKKVAEPNVNPNVTSMFGNLVAGSSSDADVVLDACDKLKLVHAPLIKKEVMPVKPQHQPERINLYYKHATGSLDMYVLSPFQSSNEYKEFLHHTTVKVNANVHKSQLNVNGTFKDIPITHLCSAVVLLTWTPNRAHENILRMLFTGNAPQHVIASALEKVKEFDILKSAVCKVKGPEVVVTKKQHVAAAAKPIQNGVADTKPAAAPNGPSVVPKVSSAKPTTSAQNGKLAAKPMVAAASNIVDLGASTSKKVDKPSVEKKEPPVVSKKSVEHSSNSAAKLVKKDEPKPAASAAVKPVVSKIDTKKISTTTTASTAATASGTATASKPKPPTKPAASAAASAKPEVEKKEPAKKSVTAPKSAPVKTTSKTSTKPTTSAKLTVAPTGDQLSTRLVAEISPASASVISTVAAGGEDQAAASSETTSKNKPTFLGSIRNAWDETFGRKKSATPTDEQPQMIQDQVVEPVVADVEEDVVIEQPQSEQQIVEVFENRDENCEVTRKEETEAVILNGAVMDNQLVEKLQCSDEAEYEFIEENEQQQEHLLEEDEDVPVIENDEVLQSEEVSSEEHHQQQQHNEIEDIPDEEIENVQDEQQQLSDEGIEEDQSPQHQQQHQQIVEVVEAATNIDVIENIINVENDERDVIDPTEVDNTPNLSPVKCNGSKTSLDMDENADEIVEIIHPDTAVAAAVEQPEPEQHQYLHLDLQPQQPPAAVVVDDVRDLIESPERTPDDEITEFKQRQDAEDVMTRSFIDNGENKNPFVENVVEQQPESQQQPAVVDTNIVDDMINNFKTALNFDNCHADGEGKENNYTNGHHNGHSKEDLIIDGLTNNHHHNEHLSSSDSSKQPTPVNPTDPATWNLLELPKPVNPNDEQTSGVESAATASSASASPTKQQPAKKQPSQQQHAESKPNKPATLNSSFSSKTATKNVTSNQKPVHPYYFDVSYVPAHGNQYYVDSDFFKRVRARYYVLSTIEPNEHVLNALVDGKQTWEDKDLPVSLIPTYETDTLKNWYMLNCDKLAALKIDISAAAIHQTLTIDNNPDIAYQVHKMEF